MNEQKYLFRLVLRVAPWMLQALPIWVWFAQDWVATQLLTIEEVWKVRAVAILLAVILLLLTWIYFLKPWLRWDDKTGTWISFFRGFRYCENCRSSKKIITPLRDEQTGWRCMVCRRWYADPKRRPPEPPKEEVKRKRI